MPRNPRRVQLTPGYVLHHQPYRDTSRILEVLTREHGRTSLFARGVRGPKAKLAAVLQPFRLLLLSWAGRGDAPQLIGAESAGGEVGLPSRALMAGFYLNELILKLTTRHDPLPVLFDAYHAAVAGLRSAAPAEQTLRFSKRRSVCSRRRAMGWSSPSSSKADARSSPAAGTTSARRRACFSP